MATTARPTRIGVIADGVLTENGNPYNLKFAVLDAQPAGVLDDLPTSNYVVGNALYRTGVILDTDGRGRGVAWPADPAQAAVVTVEAGTADAFTATADRVLAVTATRAQAASPSFSIDGLPAYAAETRDRIRAAITNAGHTWPTGKNAVYIGPNCTAPSPAFDLAAACAVLAAGGSIDPAALTQVVLIGELGLDGSIRPVADVTARISAGRAAGHRKFIVPVANFDEASQGIDVTTVGVNTLGAALDFLAEMARA
ncbi:MULTISPECIES: magnesium chelatase domain-containing protein [Streptomyces]|uniref:Lon proteolytic domain-containing protein n=1 Tax=Streptomyces canarius TaxID=285453 RepID=A0ABQ3CEW8_9ACTN|nr:magnesium chelatase domain-containing protein [Streptomyces canarius]GHA08921.1 hypothetical protein GCM10010345_11640 [Streptomyces canarius]